MEKHATITAADAGQRLDVFLSAQLPEASRSRLQKLVKSGTITVNGRRVTPHLALTKDDDVAWSDEAVAAPTLTLIPRPDLPLNVIHEDDDVLVIDKPAGLLIHPAAGETDTVANALLARVPAVSGVGDSPDRPGVVHRLDKDASGLLVLAKTKAAFDSLKKQFQYHTVLKEYVVLTAGRPPRDEGAIDLAVGRASYGGKMAARPTAKEGDRDAVTHYSLEEELPGASLLSVRTETGRTHQIRVHLNALGCPVAGDPLYGIKNRARLAAPRLFLHCRRLAFDHPVTKERLEFTSPLPKELEEYLKKLKSRKQKSSSQ